MSIVEKQGGLTQYQKGANFSLGCKNATKFRSSFHPPPQKKLRFSEFVLSLQIILQPFSCRYNQNKVL